MSDTPITQQTESILAEAKRDWRRNFAGAMLIKKPRFNTPTVRHYFERQFDQIGRNVYFISIFGRILINGDGVAAAEKNIYDRIKDVTADIQNKVNAMRAVAGEAGIADFASYPLSDKREIVAHIITPAQTRFLQVLTTADEYLVMVNTLWLEGEFNGDQKSKAEMAIKHQLGQVVSMVRRMRILLQAKVRDFQRAEAEAVATGRSSAESAAKARELERAQAETAAADSVRSEGIDEATEPNDDDASVDDAIATPAPAVAA